MAASEVEETLGWEAEQRPRAALAAILAGLMVLASTLVAALGGRDDPDTNLFEAFEAARDDRLEAVRTAEVAFRDDHKLEIIGSAALAAIGFLALAALLLFLWRATAARRPELPRFVRFLAAAGPVTVAVGILMFTIADAVSAANFLSGDDRSHEALRDTVSSPASLAGQLLTLVGSFALAVAVGLISLNAMRVGLLTRFLGVLGLIAAAVWILAGIDQLGIIRALWLISLGLLLRRALTRLPPAWQTGRAEPWPTQQEIREARDAQKRAAAGEPDPEPAARATDAPHPATAKRKRKRRG